MRKVRSGFASGYSKSTRPLAAAPLVSRSSPKRYSFTPRTAWNAVEATKNEPPSPGSGTNATGSSIVNSRYGHGGSSPQGLGGARDSPPGSNSHAGFGFSCRA